MTINTKSEFKSSVLLVDPVQMSASLTSQMTWGRVLKGVETAYFQPVFGIHVIKMDTGQSHAESLSWIFPAR